MSTTLTNYDEIYSDNLFTENNNNVEDEEDIYLDDLANAPSAVVVTPQQQEQQQPQSQPQAQPQAQAQAQPQPQPQPQQEQKDQQQPEDQNVVPMVIGAPTESQADPGLDTSSDQSTALYIGNLPWVWVSSSFISTLDFMD
jgi:FtsZ-interacting cell division protein ZipA